MPLFNETFYHNDELQNEAFQICFAGVTEPDVNYAISRENSPSIIIEYITSGIGYLEIDDKCYTLYAGNSVVIPHNTVHKYYSDKKDPYSKKWINVKGPLAESIIEFTFKDNLPIISEANIENEINQIIKLIGIKSTNEAMQLSIYTEMLSKISQSLLNVSPQRKEKRATTTAERIQRYIINHLQDRFSLKTISDVFFLSDSHIVRIFKETYKITPYRYYLNQKIELAKSLLVNTDMSIENICSKLNYSDRNHFFVAFKQVTGVSPYQYRRRYAMTAHSVFLEETETNYDLKDYFD